MSVKDLYNAEDFNILLTELGKELQYHSTLSKRFSFCIVGGGALTLAWGMRRMTTDLDVVFNKSHEEDARLVHDCAIRVAKRLGVSTSWCNDIVALSSSFTPAILVYCVPYKSFGCLDVYTIGLDFLFCMKFVSGRQKDIADLYYLSELLTRNNIYVTKAYVNSLYQKYYLAFNVKRKISFLSKKFWEGLPD